MKNKIMTMDTLDWCNLILQIVAIFLFLCMFVLCIASIITAQWILATIIGSWVIAVSTCWILTKKDII